ncbi:Serine/threonine-protein kinase STY8 [Mycena sanguinolenta]|uniref:Serine/threonine-protein kinase STY8 n=1 Tax=Mycena sanguinolenta TaxID=230812 RepID=A0A8H7DC05_9AGAR|nr:Serine/threonine-protein kinase STY8 [Mycena sanguinolenta]
MESPFFYEVLQMLFAVGMLVVHLFRLGFVMAPENPIIVLFRFEWLAFSLPMGVATTILYALKWRHIHLLHVSLFNLFWIVLYDALCLVEFFGSFIFYSSPMVRRWLDDCLLEDMISMQDSISEAVTPSLVPLGSLTEDVLHWSGCTSPSQKLKILWVTTDRKENNSRIADAIFSIVLPADIGFGPLQIDAGNQRTIILPVIHGLAGVREYTAELVRIARRDGFFLEDPGLGYDSLKSTDHLFLESLKHMHTKSGSPTTSGRTTLIIHGVRVDQTTGLQDIILALENSPQLWNIVLIGQPDLLRHNDRPLLEHEYALYVSDNGMSMYSGKNPVLPVIDSRPSSLYKNLFSLLLDAVWRSPDEKSQRIWAGLCDLRPLFLDPERIPTTADIFAVLHRASDEARWMVKSLTSLGMIVSYKQIQTCLKKDNVKICQVIRMLFEIESYKTDIQRLPQDQAFAVLNLTHSVLDSGFPNDSDIKNDKVFMRRAHRLLRLLADLLNILPAELEIRDVVLLNDRPVKYGGFANIYHGQYTNNTGEQVEVALKVLKVFHEQSDMQRRNLQEKFAKEALSWNYLKHENIVPFLGVDSSTFPGKTLAMVSQWMAHGSVLSYMLNNSPCSDYAIDFINDVIMGISYLHSVNIVHGDLCGRNILISENGRACLADFGLAMFIEQETSIKSSTRGGSTRWMAPELLLPDMYHPGQPFRRTVESDVWAFACVCCEIWSEGAIPFAGMSEGALIMAFSTPELSGVQEIHPYTSRPCDKSGSAMPGYLWDLVRSCWKREATLRPTVPVIAHAISEFRAHGGEHAMTSIDSSISSSSRSVQDTCWAPDTRNSGQLCSQKHVVVYLGPLPADHSDPREQFHTLLNQLLDAVACRDVLVPPHLVSWHNTESRHMRLCFSSAVEANSFVLTWMAHRFAPYEEVVARMVLVDTT